MTWWPTSLNSVTEAPYIAYVSALTAPQRLKSRRWA